MVCRFSENALNYKQDEYMDLAIQSHDGLNGQMTSPDETALAWQRMAEAVQQEGNQVRSEAEISEGAEVLDFDVRRQRLQEQSDAAELQEFAESMNLSPNQYWTLLRQEYAKEGVNIGLMPDTKGLHEELENFFGGLGVMETSAGRQKVALMTELNRLAGTKAAEIVRQQADGRGLPVTFESEWLQSGAQEMRELLERYYGGEEPRIGKEELQNPDMEVDEWVGWKIAMNPSRPGDLNTELLFTQTPMRKGENGAGYYRRILNYSHQGPVREAQLARDKQYEEQKQEEAQLAERAEQEQVEPDFKEKDLPLLLGVLHEAEAGLRKAQQKGDGNSQLNWERLIDRLDELVALAKANTEVERYRNERALQPMDDVALARDRFTIEMAKNKSLFDGDYSAAGVKKLQRQYQEFEKQYVDARKNGDRINEWNYKEKMHTTAQVIRALQRELDKSLLRESLD